MLLRKQSLFLLAAGILALITWGFPVATYHQAHEAFVFRTTGLYGANGVALEHIVMKVPFSIILTILGLALLVSITFYRNRPRQMRFRSWNLFAFVGNGRIPIHHGQFGTGLFGSGW
jgi:hypothetical protein